METLLPSEIARLVYGYLVEENCHDAAKTFLETSPHMRECLTVSQNGKKFQTRFEGKTLVDILDLLFQLKAQAQTVVTKMPSLSKVESCPNHEDTYKVSSPNQMSDGFGHSEVRLPELDVRNNTPLSPGIAEPPPDSSIDVANASQPGNTCNINIASASASQSKIVTNPLASDLSHGEQDAALSEPSVDLVSSKSINPPDGCEVIPRPDSSSNQPSIDLESEESEVVCLSPEMDVIEIDEDETEEESQTCTTAELPPSTSGNARRRSRKRRGRNNSSFSLKNNTSNSPRKGMDGVVGRSRPNPRLRVSPQIWNSQPSTSSSNYRWTWKPNNILPRSPLLPGPVLVNPPLMETSSFGFSQRRNNVHHAEGIQIISEKLVTRISSSQPRVSRSVISNRTLVGASVSAAPLYQNNVPLINQMGHII